MASVGVPYDLCGSPSATLRESLMTHMGVPWAVWDSLTILMGVPLILYGSPMALLGVP
jgi:hypothetical protein